MKEPVLVIIKPDGMKEGVIGNVFAKLSQAKLEMVALKIIKTTRTTVEHHYGDIKGKPFFGATIDYFLGKQHNQKKLITAIYYGDNAIKKLRTIAGATNPEEAHPNSIRGAYGRVTTKGVFENVVHVSSDKKATKREIQIWYKPDDILVDLYPTKNVSIKGCKERVWA